MENMLIYLAGAVVILGILWQLIRIFRPHKREEPPSPVTESVQEETGPNETDPNEPVSVFSGQAFDCDLLQSLLNNSEIESFQYYGDSGTMGAGLGPWNPPDRIMVARKDLDRAKEVVGQFLASLKKQESSDFDDLEELAENKPE
jgi:hypothetical protein